MKSSRRHTKPSYLHASRSSPFSALISALHHGGVSFYREDLFLFWPNVAAPTEVPPLVPPKYRPRFHWNLGRGGSRTKHSKPAPQAYFFGVLRGNPRKTMKIDQKYVILTVFTGLRQKPTVNLGRSAALPHYRPTELKIWYLGGTKAGTSVGPVMLKAKPTTIN